MFQEEVFPDNFINATLHMIIKGGKGRNEKLTDNRFIHSKSWLPRTAKALCVEDEVTSGGQVINVPNLRPIRPQIRRACIYSEIGHSKIQNGGETGHNSKLRFRKILCQRDVRICHVDQYQKSSKH